MKAFVTSVERESFRMRCGRSVDGGEGFRLTPDGQRSRSAGKAVAPVLGRVHRIDRHHDCLGESEDSSLNISGILSAFFGKSRGIRI